MPGYTGTMFFFSSGTVEVGSRSLAESEEVFEDCNGASLGDIMDHTLVVADAHESVVTTVVMDCAAPTLRAVDG